MPRYTDIDKLIAEYDRVHAGPPGGARKLMVEAPIADVAPRAEVERLEREIKALVAFKEYFSDLYGHGLAISNYHENGALEDFDNFYDAAEEEYESVVGQYAKKS